MTIGINAGAAAAAAAHAARMNAVRSFGVIVTVEPSDFMEVVRREPEPLVVTSLAGIFSAEYRYLISHKGLVFFTKSSHQLSLPGHVEIVHAKTMSIPHG